MYSTNLGITNRLGGVYSALVKTKIPKPLSNMNLSKLGIGFVHFYMIVIVWKNEFKFNIQQFE